MECKKAIARLVFYAFLAGLFGDLLTACATTEAVLGQDSEKAGYNMAKALRGNVVHVTGIVNNKKEYGLGFIVGENDKELYILTAYHVVRPLHPAPEQPIPQSAQIEFLQAQGEYKEARILPVRDEDYDIALLSVPRPEGFKWEKKAIGQPELEPSDKVWTIDSDRAWTVTSEPGSISKSDPAQITTSGLKILRGQSGGPLISKSGIIGLIYQAKPYGEALVYPLTLIKSQVAQWEKPWDLEDNYTSKNSWLWVLLGVSTAALALSSGSDNGGGDTGTIPVSAPSP